MTSNDLFEKMNALLDAKKQAIKESIMLTEADRAYHQSQLDHHIERINVHNEKGAAAMKAGNHAQAMKHANKVDYHEDEAAKHHKQLSQMVDESASQDAAKRASERLSRLNSRVIETPYANPEPTNEAIERKSLAHHEEKVIHHEAAEEHHRDEADQARKDGRPRRVWEYHEEQARLHRKRAKEHANIADDLGESLVHKSGNVEVHQSKHPFANEPSAPKHQYNIVSHENGHENWDHTTFDDKDMAIKHAKKLSGIKEAWHDEEHPNSAHSRNPSYYSDSKEAARKSNQERDAWRAAGNRGPSPTDKRNMEINDRHAADIARKKKYGVKEAVTSNIPDHKVGDRVKVKDTHPNKEYRGKSGTVNSVVVPHEQYRVDLDHSHKKNMELIGHGHLVKENSLSGRSSHIGMSSRTHSVGDKVKIDSPGHEAHGEVGHVSYVSPARTHEVDTKTGRHGKFNYENLSKINEVTIDPKTSPHLVRFRSEHPDHAGKIVFGSIKVDAKSKEHARKIVTKQLTNKGHENIHIPRVDTKFHQKYNEMVDEGYETENGRMVYKKTKDSAYDELHQPGPPNDEPEAAYTMSKLGIGTKGERKVHDDEEADHMHESPMNISAAALRAAMSFATKERTREAKKEFRFEFEHEQEHEKEVAFAKQKTEPVPVKEDNHYDRQYKIQRSLYKAARRTGQDKLATSYYQKAKNSRRYTTEELDEAYNIGDKVKITKKGHEFHGQHIHIKDKVTLDGKPGYKVKAPGEKEHMLLTHKELHNLVKENLVAGHEGETHHVGDKVKINHPNSPDHEKTGTVVRHTVEAAARGGSVLYHHVRLGNGQVAQHFGNRLVKESINEKANVAPVDHAAEFEKHMAKSMEYAAQGNDEGEDHHRNRAFYHQDALAKSHRAVKESTGLSEATTKHELWQCKGEDHPSELVGEHDSLEAAKAHAHKLAGKTMKWEDRPQNGKTAGTSDAHDGHNSYPQKRDTCYGIHHPYKVSEANTWQERQKELQGIKSRFAFPDKAQAHADIAKDLVKNNGLSKLKDKLKKEASPDLVDDLIDKKLESWEDESGIDEAKSTHSHTHSYGLKHTMYKGKDQKETQVQTWHKSGEARNKYETKIKNHDRFGEIIGHHDPKDKE